MSKQNYIVVPGGGGGGRASGSANQPTWRTMIDKTLHTVDQVTNTGAQLAEVKKASSNGSKLGLLLGGLTIGTTLLKGLSGPIAAAIGINQERWHRKMDSRDKAVEQLNRPRPQVKAPAKADTTMCTDDSSECEKGSRELIDGKLAFRRRNGSYYNNCWIPAGSDKMSCKRSDGRTVTEK